VIPVDELEGYPKRTSRLRPVLYVCIAIALLGGVLYGIVTQAPTKGGPAPEFVLTSLDGEPISSRELRGRPVVLNFWASWCYPCREEAPLLEETWQEYKDRGVVFIGVNIKDHAGDARDFVKRYGLTFPMVRDPEQTLASQLGVDLGLPQTFFITDDWHLLARASGAELETIGGTQVLGAISRAELESNIEALLEESS